MIIEITFIILTFNYLKIRSNNIITIGKNVQRRE